MTEFVSVLSCIRGGVDLEDKSYSNGSGEAGEDEEHLDEKEEKEVEDIVEDFMAMANKDMLRRDLKRMATENVNLRKKVARLEAKAKAGGASAGLSFQIDCSGQDAEGDAEDENSSFIYDPVGLGAGSALGSRAATPPPPESEKQSRSSCFNCLGPHNMAECKEPRDGKRIAANRKAFQSSAANSARFFEEGKREGIRPGLPSPALREALNLKPDQVPEYIYRLRELGYPPGWKRTAEIRESGLGIYHKGEEGGKDDDGDHERESVRFDTNKLISWPGFNTELPREFKDEGSRYRVKPQSRCESLKEMKRGMSSKSQKGYRKRKMQDDSSKKTVYDMEVEEGECDDDLNPPGEKVVVLEKSTEEGESKEKTEEVLVQPIGTGTIATTDTGTPIVEMYSSFGSLPDNAKWGVNMSEHVAFENLPNYTGHWDKMKAGVIQKIRDRKAEEEKEDEEDS